MDISNEASIVRFSIGPSTFLGRTIAFRILLCRSMSHFRHKMLRIFLKFMYKFNNGWGSYLSPLISWFNPKNPKWILVMVTMIAFLLKRFACVRAEMAYKRRVWSNIMKSPLTYDEWAHAAQMLDNETQRANDADLYDEELVRNKCRELRHRRQEGSIRDIMFYMRADLVRNLGNMCNPELHKGRLHVPKLIKEYIDEVTAQLRMVCDADSELEEKLSFMHETRHAFGRTALLLSGGASLGGFHVGVVKTLVEHKLLPRIIAGSSIGSAMCAVVGTRSWPELQSFFEDSWRSFQFFDQMGGIFTVFKRIMTQGVVHDIRRMQMMLRHLTNNLTFQEAYDMTGRILGITVCSPRKHEPPRCLNYLTSPHVLIWSAVTASCAFPGIFEAQELMAKDRSGNIVPYHPPCHLDPEEGVAGLSTRRWRDGSLEIDLPMKQLKELFNVNHFIVSQTNPHVAPILRLKQMVRTYGGSLGAKIAQLTEMEIKHRCNQILELGLPLGRIAKLFAQDWEGDITIFMPATLDQISKAIQNPSYVDLQKSISQGRRCTWEKLSAMKANCAIEVALDECVAALKHARRLKRSADRAANAAVLSPSVKFNPCRRIPSWNVIDRDNSTSSLDEAALMPDPPLSPAFIARNNSDSVDQHSWTRCGGPLMRTVSSKRFVDFVQNLKIDSNRGILGSPNCQTPEGYRSRASSDLMQPECTDNGIVFNLARKPILSPSKLYCSPLESVEELVQHDAPQSEMDDSSMSESGGGDSDGGGVDDSPFKDGESCIKF